MRDSVPRGRSLERQRGVGHEGAPVAQARCSARARVGRAAKSELERVHLQMPAQAARRLDGFDLHHPTGKKLLQHAT